MRAATLDLDLEVFQGPFDLLTTLVLKEEIDLLEVDLAEVVLAYVEHLERVGELDLEATTEFLVLIAGLLELKSRLMLPRENEEVGEQDRGEAAAELLARMLEYRRYRAAAAFLHACLASESGFRYRAAPLPPALRRVSLEAASKTYEAAALAEAVGGLLRAPPRLDLDHLARPLVTLEERLLHLRSLLASGGELGFDDATAGADRLTEAMTLLALLELYRSGELDWRQDEPFGPIAITATAGSASAAEGVR